MNTVYPFTKAGPLTHVNVTPLENNPPPQPPRPPGNGVQVQVRQTGRGEGNTSHVAITTSQNSRIPQPLPTPQEHRPQQQQQQPQQQQQQQQQHVQGYHHASTASSSSTATNATTSSITSATTDPTSSSSTTSTSSGAPSGVPTKRGPGRPKGSGRKHPLPPSNEEKIKRPVGRPRKDGLPAGSVPRSSRGSGSSSGGGSKAGRPPKKKGDEDVGGGDLMAGVNGIVAATASGSISGRRPSLLEMEGGGSGYGDVEGEMDDRLSNEDDVQMRPPPLQDSAPFENAHHTQPFYNQYHVSPQIHHHQIHPESPQHQPPDPYHAQLSLSPPSPIKAQPPPPPTPLPTPQLPPQPPPPLPASIPVSSYSSLTGAITPTTPTSTSPTTPATRRPSQSLSHIPEHHSPLINSTTIGKSSSLREEDEWTSLVHYSQPEQLLPFLVQALSELVGGGAEQSVIEEYIGHVNGDWLRDVNATYPQLYSALKTFWLPTRRRIFMPPSPNLIHHNEEHRFFFWDPLRITADGNGEGLRCPMCHNGVLLHCGISPRGPLRVFDIPSSSSSISSSNSFWVIGCEYECPTERCPQRRWTSWDGDLRRMLSDQLQDEFPVAGIVPRENNIVIGVSRALWKLVLGCLKTGMGKDGVLNVVSECWGERRTTAATATGSIAANPQVQRRVSSARRQSRPEPLLPRTDVHRYDPGSTNTTSAPGGSWNSPLQQQHQQQQQQPSQPPNSQQPQAYFPPPPTTPRSATGFGSMQQQQQSPRILHQSPRLMHQQVPQQQQQQQQQSPRISQHSSPRLIQQQRPFATLPRRASQSILASPLGSPPPAPHSPQLQYPPLASATSPPMLSDYRAPTPVTYHAQQPQQQQQQGISPSPSPQVHTPRMGNAHVGSIGMDQGGGMYGVGYAANHATTTSAASPSLLHQHFSPPATTVAEQESSLPSPTLPATYHESPPLITNASMLPKLPTALSPILHAQPQPPPSHHSSSFPNTPNPNNPNNSIHILTPTIHPTHPPSLKRPPSPELQTLSAKRIRHCSKCGSQECKGKGGIGFCVNPCRDCGESSCKGRNSKKPERPCVNASTTRGGGGGGEWVMDGT